MKIHKSNNIYKNMILQWNTTDFLLNFTILSYGVDKPQEYSFKTIQFNYFQHYFHLRDTLFLLLLHVWSLAK